MRNNEINFNKSKILRFVISLQLTLVGVVAMDFVGIEIPILREAIGFIYLAFVPGILILLILRLEKLNPVEIILYSIGLSLSFLIFVSLAMNTLYPLIGISNPLSEIPLIITISGIVLFLLTFCYTRDKENLSKFTSVNIGKLFHPSTLALLLLPFMSIFGTYLLNFYDNNILLLTLLAIISIIPILATLDRIPKEVYPIAIWCISISLLFYHTLILNRIIPSSGLLRMEKIGFWDPTIPDVHTPLLAESAIPFIYFVVCKISPILVYKIIYPLLSSITPVILYQAYKRQVSENISFLSCFFFMSPFFFIAIFGECVRTGFAILFIAFLILLMADNSMKRVKRSGLAMIFASCLVMSHYGTSYIFMIALVCALLLLLLNKGIEDQPNRVADFITTTFVSLYIVFIFAWYIYTGSGKGFNWFVNFGNHIISSIQEEFLAPESSYTLMAVHKTWSSLSIEITKHLFVVASIFIAIGILYLVYCLFRKQTIFHIEYSAFSLSFFGILVLIALFPVGLNESGRPFQIAATFLAPFCIIGGTKLIESGKKVLKITVRDRSKNRGLNNEKTKYNLVIFSVFLIIFLLFNSGFMSEVVFKDYSAEVGISKKRIMESEVTNSSIHAKMWFYTLYTPTHDFFSSEWLVFNGDLEKIVYADYMGRLRLSNYLTPPAAEKLMEENLKVRSAPLVTDIEIQKDTYIYFGYHNYVNGVVLIDRFSEWYNVSEIQSTLEEKSKIYTNGGSIIYLN